MRKITSIASLGLRLTWLRVAGVAAATGLAQWLCFAGENAGAALESRMDGAPAFIGRMGYLALLLALYYTMSAGKGGGMDMTLRRLPVSEWTVTAVWSLLFAGYYLMYWAMQIGLCLGMYGRAVHTHGAAENLLFVAGFRSEWFHELLPLREPWGFARNVALALGFGSFAALGARNARRGRWNPLCLCWLMAIGWALLSQGTMATRTADVTFILLSLFCVAGDWYWSWRWTEDEAP